MSVRCLCSFTLWSMQFQCRKINWYCAQSDEQFNLWIATSAHTHTHTPFVCDVFKYHARIPKLKKAAYIRLIRSGISEFGMIDNKEKSLPEMSSHEIIV